MFTPDKGYFVTTLCNLAVNRFIVISVLQLLNTGTPEGSWARSSREFGWDAGSPRQGLSAEMMLTNIDVSLLSHVQGADFSIPETVPVQSQPSKDSKFKSVPGENCQRLPPP